ncbi:unnamed protein product [Hymenolepis diminuta]|uniref:Uncharacterized protein n=1 Tax=Hymenolepis diminuta TaxID=6216 RepID=A0A564YTR4_HYMDI|nr:unnamed protein product [Hymenolepis diminuta]
MNVIHWAEIIELFLWCLFWTVGVPHMVKRQHTSEEACSVLSFDISGKKFLEYREVLNEIILQVCSLHPGYKVFYKILYLQYLFL